MRVLIVLKNSSFYSSGPKQIFLILQLNSRNIIKGQIIPLVDEDFLMNDTNFQKGVVLYKIRKKYIFKFNFIAKQLIQKNIQEMIFMQSLERNKQESIKHRMFYLHHQVIKHYSISNQLYGFLLFIQMLQMIYYAIHSTYPNLWPLSITDTIQTIFTFIQLGGIWAAVGQSALFIFIVIILLMYIVNISFVLYEIFKTQYKNKQPNMIAYKYMAYVGILTKTVLLIPTVNATLSFIASSPSNSQGVQISSAWYGTIAAVSIPTFILLLLNTINYVIFLRQNNPFSSLPFVGSVTQNQEVRTLIKLMIAIYGSIILNEGPIGKIFCIALFAAHIFYLLKIYHAPRMLRWPYNILTQLAPCITIWFCICTLLEQFVYPNEQIGLLFLAFGVILVPFTWTQILQKYKMQILYSSYKFLTSPEELLYYNYECLNCVNNLQQKRNLIYMEGVLNYHISQCKKSSQSCVCFNMRQKMSNFKLQGEKVEIAQQKQLWFTFIKSNLTDIKEKYRNIAEISLLLAYIQRDQLKNKFKALHNLEEPSHFSSGLKIQFLNYHYLRQIEERMFNEDRIANQKKSVDVNKFLDFETSFGKLQKAIQDSTYSHFNFWSNLASQRASKTKLIEDGKAINVKVAQTKYLYQKLIQINPSNLHCLIIYANYMKIIVNNPQVYQKSNESIKIIKRNIINSSKLNNDPEKQKYADNAVTGVIVLSGQRSNIGVIKHCSTKITELIKYSPHELLGQNINILMPKFIGSMHDDILMSYLEFSESKTDNNQRLAPMIDKQNYMVFARILTKPLPSLFNGLQLVGAFNLVSQSHIDHPGQTPKYVLYRTDSGHVQALSETCDLQFNYRINKIDQNHQTSSQLTFNSLFSGIKDSQLTSIDKSVKSKVKIFNEQSEQNEISVEVYLRHQIYYFGVKLNLLYFFNVKNFKSMARGEQIQDNDNGVYKKIMIQQQQAEGIKGHGQSQKSNQVAKEKKIRQLMRKKNNTVFQPISLKILSRFGYFIFLFIAVGAIGFLIEDLSKLSYLSDYLNFSRINLQTESQIVQINFYSRMKHLAAYYPLILNQYDCYSSNITILSSQLQNKQFQLVQYDLAAQSNGLTYAPPLLKWSMNQKLQVTSSNSTMDVNVFDYITSASHFESASIGDLAFPLTLLSKPTAQYSFSELFKIRYTGLFQTIPSKYNFHQNSNTYFNKIQSNILNNTKIEFGLICAGLLIVLCIVIPLQMCLQGFINQTVMLFGYMSIHEIQKQVNNCNSFLQIFFKDSYRVKLNSKKKVSQMSKSGLQNSTSGKNKPIKSAVALTQSNQIGYNATQITTLNRGAQRVQRGSLLLSAQKVQALEEQFKQLTLHNIQDQNKGDKEDEKQQLIKNNYDQDQSIYYKLSQTKDNSKYIYIGLFVLLFGIFFSYFIVRYNLNLNNIFNRHNDINSFRMVTQNLNLMKKVKLYCMQTVIDNLNFQNYSLLGNIAVGHVNDLYQHQRDYNSYIYLVSAQLASVFSNNLISSLVKSSLCTQQNINLYLSVNSQNNFYPNSSYSVGQCEKIQQGILIQGLRPALIAFTQILYNFTKLPHTVDQMTKSDKFESIIKMQKYLQGAQLFFIEKLYHNITQILQSYRSLQIILCIVIVLLAILLLLFIWWPMMKNLGNKIISSSQILGLIPIRIFIKNVKLAKQYEKFITRMLD